MKLNKYKNKKAENNNTTIVVLINYLVLKLSR